MNLESKYEAVTTLSISFMSDLLNGRLDDEETVSRLNTLNLKTVNLAMTAVVSHRQDIVNLLCLRDKADLSNLAKLKQQIEKGNITKPLFTLNEEQLTKALANLTDTLFLN